MSEYMPHPLGIDLDEWEEVDRARYRITSRHRLKYDMGDTPKRYFIRRHVGVISDTGGE